MEGGKSVRELFAAYCGDIDVELERLLGSAPAYDMYGHMSYFMGFANTDLKPEAVYAGKRFRSGLALMLGDWYGVKSATLPVAASIELFHNFTLIHDDIVDGDTERRGRPTVWKLFGTDHAINSGDGQLLLSLETISETADLSAEQKVAVQLFLARQYRKVVEGQYLDFELTKAALGDPGVTESAYTEMIGRKTADLIAAATKAPGMVAGLSESEQEQLFTFGYQLGLAYQICDDVVSIWGTTQDTGKRAYGDLLERKKTLPILHLYAVASESDRETLVSLYSSENSMDDAAARQIIELLDTYKVYEYMRTHIETTAAAAKQAANTLSVSAEQHAILDLVVDALLPDIKAR